MQASQPITTAEVLQQWQQEVYTRQTQHARQQPAAELPFPRKHLNRSRRSQRLNIVPTSDKTANSNQQASQFMHEGSNQQSASSGMPSTHRSQSAYRTAAEKRPQPKSAPKGTNLRSLATSSMLMSHAQLLQQLQQAVQPSSISASKAEGMQVTSTNSVNGLPTSLLNRSAGPETTNSLQSTPAMRHGHVNVTHQQAAAYKGPENQNSDAELDTISLTLDLVDNQLPSWSNKQPLDWSAQQDISCYQPQVMHSLLCMAQAKCECCYSCMPSGVHIHQVDGVTDSSVHPSIFSPRAYLRQHRCKTMMFPLCVPCILCRIVCQKSELCCLEAAPLQMTRQPHSTLRKQVVKDECCYLTLLMLCCS